MKTNNHSNDNRYCLMDNIYEYLKCYIINNMLSYPHYYYKYPSTLYLERIGVLIRN